MTPAPAPDAIEFVDVHKAFGATPILTGVDLSIPEGRISTIIGPSGTGKSVCIKHMVGLLSPDRGDVIVHGESVARMDDEALYEMRQRFGVLFQDGALFGSMTLLENVCWPLFQHTDRSEDEIVEIARRRLADVGLADAAQRMPNELSGGMRKRAGFARALAMNPDIVLFDEPDSGLDPVRTALLGELIQQVHREMTDAAIERGAENLPAFCIVTHDIATARRVADELCVIWRGRIVESGAAEQVFASDNAFVRQFLAGESTGPLGME
jgi:phospholipid/cholesterol/gamma-HCH transport system ATP-binding protein